MNILAPSPLRFAAAPKPLPEIDLSVPGSVQDHPDVRNAPGHLVVLSGPSGVGKGTAKGGLLADPEFKAVNQIKSYKTRQLRPGESGADSDCVRIPVEQFEQRAKNGEMFQYTNYAGNWYGTVLKDITDTMKNKGVAFMEVTAEFALQIKKVYKDKVTTVLLAPPSKDELLARLRGRGTEDEATIQKRISHADSELALQPYFDHTILAETKEGTLKQLKDIVRPFLPKAEAVQPKSTWQNVCDTVKGWFQ